MKIVTIVGARPQFIKAAVISRVIARTAGVEERLVHTGQHYDPEMSQIFFDELHIPAPHHQLHTGSGSHAVQTARMLVEIESVLQEESPDGVLVYGDTNSTLAGALASSKLGLSVIHVEAGLRSFDRSMPEEINRVMTDRLSHVLFCPTDAAVNNLAREGIVKDVHQVGDVMYDALLHYRQEDLPAPTLQSCGLKKTDPYALCTLHRAGNVDDDERFARVWGGLSRLAERLPVVLPLHPRARQAFQQRGLTTPPRIHITPPVGYREMLDLERRARLIVTDSGGVQKEAYLHGVPCLTLRENTEWTETVDAGWNRLVGVDADLLLGVARRFLEDGRPKCRPSLYGDGHAGEKIVDVLTAARPKADARNAASSCVCMPQAGAYFSQGAAHEVA